MTESDPNFLCGLAFALLLGSLALPAVSVHNYCENRAIAGVFGSGALIVGFVLARQPATPKAIKIVGLMLSFLSLAINVLFVAYATHLCRHMFDQLKP